MDVARRRFVIGIVGWIVLFAALLAWEGLGLVRAHDQWPTLSDMLRMVSRSTIGRWSLFAFWLWMGWHLFIRGWEFFLRGQIDETSSTSHAAVPVVVSLGQTLRQDVGPVLGVFFLLMLVVTYYVTRTRRERPAIAQVPLAAEQPRDWEHFFRYLLKTVAAGYAVFVAAMLLYYVGVARQDATFLRDVLAGGAFMAIGVAVPAFTAITWVKVVRGRREEEAPASAS